MKEKNVIKLVIGSWGSYTACNRRAMGSNWLDLADFESWDEIKIELLKEGFDLDGDDAELFIQDVIGVNSRAMNWDYANVKEVCEVIWNSGILDDHYKKEVFDAFLEIEDFTTWTERVLRYGESWDDDLYLWSDWDDIVDDFIGCHDIPSWLENYINREAIARDLSYDQFYNVSNGVLEKR